MDLTRRRFLRGALTLAVLPALVLPGDGLTPLETAMERLRHVRLQSLLTRSGQSMPTLKAVQALRDLGFDHRQVIVYTRLAFRMAKRDYRLTTGIIDGSCRAPDPRVVAFIRASCPLPEGGADLFPGMTRPRGW